MASGTGTAPSLFLRNATGLVKGWSGFDAFTLLVHVGEPRHAGHVLQPGGVRLRAHGEPDPVDRPGGDRGDVPGGRLLGPDRGDAARRRRLHLAEPRPRRDPRRPDRRRGRRGRRLPRRPGDRPRSDAGARDGRRRRDRRRRDRLPQRRHRVRPGRQRLVVHPRDVGADLRRDPQHRVLPAARGAGQVRRRPVVLRLGERHPVRVDRDHRPDVGARRARHGRLRADPEVVPVRSASSASRSWSS